jgi:hypothetical protein
MYTLQTYLAGPVKGKEGIKAYAIAGRHTLMVAQFQHTNGTLREPEKSIMRVAKVFQLSRIGEYGAVLLGTKDNQLSQEAAKYGMTFLDRV